MKKIILILFLTSGFFNCFGMDPVLDVYPADAMGCSFIATVNRNNTDITGVQVGSILETFADVDSVIFLVTPNVPTTLIFKKGKEVKHDITIEVRPGRDKTYNIVQDGNKYSLQKKS